VGHSFGGAVVCAYAGKHPDRLAGLVFADAAGDLTGTPSDQVEGLRRGLDPPNFDQFTDAWFNSILEHAKPATRTAVLASLRATPREVFRAASLSLYSFHLNDALARYSGPRLSIASMLADKPYGISKSIPAIPVEVISDASHWLMMDKPDEFNRILDGFLARAGGPRAAR
jgi:pimeloyl-ACP methyl ester carboxylesterase